MGEDIEMASPIAFSNLQGRPVQTQSSRTVRKGVNRAFRYGGYGTSAGLSEAEAAKAAWSAMGMQPRMPQAGPAQYAEAPALGFMQQQQQNSPRLYDTLARGGPGQPIGSTDAAVARMPFVGEGENRLPYQFGGTFTPGGGGVGVFPEGLGGPSAPWQPNVTLGPQAPQEAAPFRAPTIGRTTDVEGLGQANRLAAEAGQGIQALAGSEAATGIGTWKNLPTQTRDRLRARHAALGGRIATPADRAALEQFPEYQEQFDEQAGRRALTRQGRAQLAGKRALNEMAREEGRLGSQRAIAGGGRLSPEQFLQAGGSVAGLPFTQAGIEGGIEQQLATGPTHVGESSIGRDRVGDIERFRALAGRDIELPATVDSAVMEQLSTDAGSAAAMGISLEEYNQLSPDEQDAGVTAGMAPEKAREIKDFREFQRRPKVSRSRNRQGLKRFMPRQFDAPYQYAGDMLHYLMTGQRVPTAGAADLPQ